MKSKSSPKQLYIFLLIMLGVMIGGYYLLSSKTREMKNWAVYRNDKFAVEFRHPNTWYAYEAESSNYYAHIAFLPVGYKPDLNTAQELPKNTIFSLYLRGRYTKPIDEVYQEAVDGSSHNPNIKVEKLEIGGYPAVQTTDGITVISFYGAEALFRMDSLSQDSINRIFSTFRVLYEEK